MTIASLKTEKEFET